MLHIDQKRLIEFLCYDPDTGVFTRRKSFFKNAAGSVAGFHTKQGYLDIRFDGSRFAAHRLAWVYVYGHLPEMEIDHINGIKDDNRICNLRLATKGQNAQNRVRYPAKQKKQSGFMGATWVKAKSKWRARIMADGVLHHLGYFETCEEAGLAYADAKARLHTFNPIIRNNNNV